MPRKSSALTVAAIRKTKPAEKPVKLTDGSGMYLLLKPDGSRYWRLDYRFDGKRKTLALGVYPEVSLTEARARRGAARELLAKGRDPAISKRNGRSRNAVDAGTLRSPVPAQGKRGSEHASDRVSDRGLPARQKRLLLTIATVSEHLLADVDEPELMRRICQTLVDDRLFRMAWIGLVADDGVTVQPVAQSGFAEGYLENIGIRCDDSPQGQGPTGTAIREGKAVVNPDTETNRRFARWRDRARAQGYRSSASTPIRQQSRIIGALSVYSSEPHAFESDEVLLLEKLAADLGIALERRAAVRALQDSEMRFRTMAEHSEDLIWAIDTQGQHTYANRNIVTMLGYEMEEVIGIDPLGLVHPDDQALYRETHATAVARKTGWRNVSLRWRHRDGSYRVLESTASPLFDAAGELIGFQGIDRDITERMAAAARIEFLAHHDALTSLPNRILLRDRFEQALHLADRDETHVAMLFLDLDNFKIVNDTLGHGTGDMLLQAVVSRITQCMRDTDTVCRQGGDEFILLLNDIPDIETVERVAGGILAGLTESFEVNGHVLNISCSIGVSLYPEDGRDFDALLQKADAAMYNAKEAGRNTYRFFSETMNQRAHEHLLLQNRMHQALQLGEFTLEYQPQLDLVSGRVLGAEALLRWRNPDLGVVSPARFIPVAEDSGFIVALGAWVLREACRQAQAWRAAGLVDLAVSVNLSALQFRRDNLVETVTNALRESGLPAHLLELELTESILLQNVEVTLATVRRLKAMGVRLSIDDFGTGYSSLSYLKRFTVDKLKIDQSFVRDIGTDPDDAAIVRAIIQMARSLRLGIIAEGVENAEQLEFLRNEGCQEIQGYHFSRPLTAENFLAFMCGLENARP